MVKDTNKHLILIFAIFIFAFLYRFLLMTHGTFPSGPDIGLHNSVIYSIINQGGNVDFLYNYYQMGGGLSLTFPGYHIFVAHIMLLTGMTEYLVHAIIASLFSSILVLVSYLITRAVWKESAAMTVALLMAISRFDVDMLIWGGYPNVTTLWLIPLTFYLYLQKNRFTKTPFYISTSLLISSIFLSHSLSSVVFVSILFSVIIFGLIFNKKIGTTRNEMLNWLLPIISGALIVLPYLIQIVPAYLTNTTNSEISRATAATRILPLNIILPIFVIVGFYFLLSKKHHKQYFNIPTILFALWILVPAVFTQGHLIGLYTDFYRFLYFILLPIIVLIGLFIDFSSEFLTNMINKYHTLTNQLNNTVKTTEQVTHKRLSNLSNKLHKKLTKTNLHTGFLLSFLLICFLFIPVFLHPNVGLEAQKYYQEMNTPLYQSMQWVKANTPDDATFLTEASYGWWLAGFAQRPTWSALEPQFLSLSREVPIAQTATNILDTDYLFESSFKHSGEILNIQIREDGGYMARHNPQIFACLNWTYTPYSFFNFNSNQTKILYEVNGTPKSVALDKLHVIDMHMENDTQHVTVSITRGNEYFTCTQFTTVYQGSKFVNITILFEAMAENVSLSWMQTLLDVNASPMGSEKPVTIGFLAKSVDVFGQVIFNKNIPEVNSRSYDIEDTCVYLDYNLGGKQHAETQISLTAYSVVYDGIHALYHNNTAVNDFINKQIDVNLEPENRDNIPLPTPFNYQTELKVNEINYIAITRYYEKDSNAAMKLKFVNDPLFNLVFINPEVAIFKVS
ncbi:MAG: hypothetical protein FWE56_00130 [Candidatus Bathyarchaeota archaeon]|nr:hypothetical protein [Candidatus Termiticorpusculum sp.]MCL2867823.1 hypothetical protein [Candidatus Termiticorpusculum sp.]